MLHLYTPGRPGGGDRQGRAPHAQPLRRAAGAVLPARLGAARGAGRPVDRHRGARRSPPIPRLREHARGARLGRARLRRRGAAVRHRRRQPRGLPPAVPTSWRCWTPTRPAPVCANQLAFRLKLLLAAGLAPQLGGCAVVRRARAPDRLLAARPGGVVCGACEASAFPLDVGGPRASWSAALGRPLAEAPQRSSARCARPSGRSARRVEHHAHVRCAAPPRSASWLRRVATKWVYDFSEGSREHARPARRQGRQRRRDDAGPRRRARARGLHHHDRGLRRLHARRQRARRPRGARSPRRWRGWRSRRASGWATPSDPLLVSVRSGARESMPGMLDTVLNLGLNDASVEGLAPATGNERFAWDSYRRFVQMFGNVVAGRRRASASRTRSASASASAASSWTPSSTPTRCTSSPTRSRGSTAR